MRPLKRQEISSKLLEPGDILFASHRELRKGFHPIVYISGRSEFNFIGAMITHDPHNGDNVQMNDSHFVPGFRITFDNTYLVRARLIKPEEWGPFEKVGQLTKDGTTFVKDALNGLPEESFSNYFYRSRIITTE